MSSRGPTISTVQDLMQLAELLYRGGCTPPGMDSPTKVAVVILAGLEIGLAPTQAIGSIMLTGGKPSIYGDGAMALVLASGQLDFIDEQIVGEGEQRHAVCNIQRKGQSVKVYTFSMADANKAGLIERAKGRGPWVSYPDRMLRFRARGFAFRDLFPDILRGLIFAEEAQDMLADADQVAVVHATQRAIEAAPATATQPSLITDEQLRKLADLRQLMFAGMGIVPDGERAKRWAEHLAPFNATSAKTLTYEQAEQLIATLGREHDPFGSPATGPASSSV